MRFKNKQKILRVISFSAIVPFYILGPPYCNSVIFILEERLTTIVPFYITGPTNCKSEFYSSSFFFTSSSSSFLVLLRHSLLQSF